MVSGMSLQSFYHEFVSVMSCFSSKSETIHITCHVCMGTTSFSMHIWLKFGKGVLFYALSTSMPFLVCHDMFL